MHIPDFTNLLGTVPDEAVAQQYNTTKQYVFSLRKRLKIKPARPLSQKKLALLESLGLPSSMSNLGRVELKSVITQKLGAKCSLCGFDNVLALQIHHTKENGNEHRKSVHMESVYKDILIAIKNGSSEYVLLCANCHWQLHHPVQANSQSAKKRLKAINALGSKCAQCECDNVLVLQIDHVAGGGKLHKHSFGDHTAYYNHILKSVLNGEHTFQLLCANCNWIKRYTNNEVKGRPTNVAKIDAESKLQHPNTPSD